MEMVLSFEAVKIIRKWNISLFTTDYADYTDNIV